MILAIRRYVSVAVITIYKLQRCFFQPAKMNMTNCSSPINRNVIACNCILVDKRVKNKKFFFIFAYCMFGRIDIKYFKIQIQLLQMQIVLLKRDF